MDTEDTDRGSELREELYGLVQSDGRIFEFLQAGSLDGIWYWDLTDPEHEWMSPRFWETFGYDPMLRSHRASEWQDMINPEDLELAKANVAKHIADPSQLYDQIVRYRGGDGNTVWVRCRGMAVFRDGVPVRMLGAHTDVTALKKAEAELVRNNEALRRANTDLEALAYATSHDIRSPLRTLAGLLQILEEDHRTELGVDGREVLTLAAGAVDRLQRTVAGVVEFASATAATADFTDVDVGDIVEDVVADFREDILAVNGDLEVTPLPRIRGNAPALSHIFSNLLSNALKFRVDAPASPRIEIGVEGEPDGWRFFVRDNGPGIALANRDRLFKPFSRLHRRADVPGAGLGLAICRRCVDLHAGRIWVDDRYEGGTQFNVFIPRLEAS